MGTEVGVGGYPGYSQALPAEPSGWDWGHPCPVVLVKSAGSCLWKWFFCQGS